MKSPVRTPTVDHCPFCGIIRGEEPAHVLQRTSEYLVFSDIAPQAPLHLLVIPTTHFATLSELVAETGAKLAGKLVEAASECGRRLAPHGFRVLVNEGPEGHQTVGHVHIHVMGGREMGWPPG